MQTTTARAIKVTLLLDPAPLANIHVPNGLSRFELAIDVEGRRLRADLSAKSMRRAVTAIAARGPAAVTLILQGRLGPNNDIVEAGLAVQPKPTQSVQAEAA